MANVKRTVDIIFNGVNLVSKPAMSIVKSLDKVIDKVESLAAPVANTVDKLLKMEAAILAVGAAIGTIALASFKSYEYALIDLEKVLSDGEVITGKNQVAMEKLAIQYGMGAADVTKATTDFKRAGFTLEESIILLNRSLELSSAGMVGLADSTNNIIAIMKGFEFGVKDATHVVDVINKVSDTYATNANELSDALRRVAPAAKLAGLSIEETTAYITPAIEVFRSGEEAGTAWRRGLIKLTDDAKPVIAALDRLGVAQREGPNKELRKGGDILKDLIVAMQGATSSNQLFAASQIFGNRQAAKMIATLRDLNYTAGIETVARMVNHQYTIDQVEKRWNSLEVQLGATKSAITLAAAELGGNLKPAVVKVLGATTELFSSFRDELRDGAFDTLFNLLENFSDDLADYLKSVGMQLPKALQEVDYSALIKAFEGLFDKLSEIVDRFKLDTPEGLQDFLQETTDTSAALVEATTGLVNAFDKVALKVLNVIRGFTELSSTQQQAAGEFGGWAKAIDKFGVKMLGVLDLVDTRIKTIANILSTIDAGSRWIDNLGKANEELEKTDNYSIFNLGSRWLDKLTGASGSIEKVGEDASKMANKIGNASKTTEKNIDDIESVFKDLSRSAETNIDDISEMFTSDLVNAVISAIDKLPKEISTKVTIDDDGIDDDIQAAADKLLAANKQFTENAKFNASIEMDSAAKDFIDRVSGTGAYAGKEIGVFTDSDLAYLENNLAALKKDLANTTTAIEDSTSVELDVPDDKKFEAAQKKLLAEIDANADIMGAKMKGFATIMESENETITASFGSIGESINATGDTLSKLYDQLGSKSLDIFAQQSIQKRIRDEESRREEAFALQKELTLAQIDLIKQRASAMASGDPLITVSGDGLQPHLEAFMWEILSAIQVRVNEDYGNFLLGIGA